MSGISKIPSGIITIIKSYLRTRKGKQDFEWLQKNHPKVANAIKKGLKYTDTASDATQLNRHYDLYAKTIPVAQNDAQEIQRIQKKITSAKKIVTNLQNKLKGRNARKYSHRQRKIICSDIKYAKTIVKYWEDERDDAMDNITKSANSLANHSTRVVSAYKRLSKKL